MLRYLPIPEKIVLLPEPRPALGPTLEEEVEGVWKRERNRPGSTLFNGPIFSVEEISPDTASGRYVGYRHFIAQERRPDLFCQLRVQPLAVTGILQNPEGVFFGYRNSTVAVQPDCWELIPSGGIDRSTLRPDGQLDPSHQLLTELREEVGLADAAVAPPKVLFFTEDTVHHIFELIWELKTDLSREAVLRAHASLREPEHPKIGFVRWADLEGFLGQENEIVLPATRYLIEHLLENRRKGI
jgi:hypothetical protein